MTLLTHWEGEPVAVWRRLWGVPEVEVHARIGSTSDRIRELARSGADPWTVVLAEEQTAGRGRSGEVWHSPPGAGLWISVLSPAEPPAPCLPLLVGLAAAGALEEAAGVEVGIKWPNDLVVADRKVGGILCEGSGRGIVVGVGLNVREPEGGFPPELRDVAVSAERAAGRAVSRSRVAATLLAGLRARLDSRGGEGEGVERLTEEERAELARRDVLRGRRVGTAAGSGTARGVDASGALLVERDDGAVVPVVAGSVRPA